jgi:hypothetical protein
MIEGNAYNQAVADMQQTVNGIRLALSNSTSCTNAMTAAGALASLTEPYNPVIPNQTVYPVNSLATLFSIGNIISGAPELILKSAQFYKFQDISPNPILNPETHFSRSPKPSAAVFKWLRFRSCSPRCQAPVG